MTGGEKVFGARGGCPRPCSALKAGFAETRPTCEPSLPCPPASDPPSLVNWGDWSRSGHRVNSTTSPASWRDVGAGITALADRAPPHRAGDPRAAQLDQSTIPANGRIVGLTAPSRTTGRWPRCVTPPRLLQPVHHLKVQPELRRCAEPFPQQDRCLGRNALVVSGQKADRIRRTPPSVTPSVVVQRRPGALSSAIWAEQPGSGSMGGREEIPAFWTLSLEHAGWRVPRLSVGGPCVGFVVLHAAPFDGSVAPVGQPGLVLVPAPCPIHEKAQ
jgi:hypothetical protein